MFKLNTDKANISIGARGEKAAVSYLKKIGYAVLATNFCNETGRRLGEIDIIAKDGTEIVFIEVKTRVERFGKSNLPEENINKAKLYKLNKAASFYISKNKLFDAQYRFDAITIMANLKENSATLHHLKNIFI
ncbi:MAG: hypothetical protein US57_C0016G0026 [Candidatus Moranbacteria bacterium GW2011_GWC2_37_73]|nr:MAG: hypothetical protein UR95_C0002G0009 [Parcubacteria group bacterium GW2011_GWC1_36_108]KKQ00221.1 MAG: hypothetical protein US09_C0017G0008 [Candidatus Moranbacteria bacterium GW2011_GWD1_36_198]KKQ00336.1 MAG: hypothetical protein US10_C0034G0006 [Candidatus Moranbacteria bacterium GW2011_GWD2_36_198]KKQ39271.1 MAG: hypothetical protein US57_C0016G0026 [Candidatus Moranbacteria bacterium GW2011_GWC2_37_73]HAR99600.1 YraN family protein [Candidatus Moranbacteria bacterium]